MKCKLCGGEFYETRMVPITGTIVLSDVVVKVEAKVCHTCSARIGENIHSLGFKMEEP